VKPRKTGWNIKEPGIHEEKLLLLIAVISLLGVGPVGKSANIGHGLMAAVRFTKTSG